VLRQRCVTTALCSTELCYDSVVLRQRCVATALCCDSVVLAPWESHELQHDFVEFETISQLESFIIIRRIIGVHHLSCCTIPIDNWWKSSCMQTCVCSPRQCRTATTHASQNRNESQCDILLQSCGSLNMFLIREIKRRTITSIFNRSYDKVLVIQQFM